MGVGRTGSRDAALAAALLTVVALAGCDSSSHVGSQHPAAGPLLYTAVGQIEGYPKTDPRFCLTGDFASAADGPRVTRDPCLNETVLRNFDARELPMTIIQGGGSRSKGTVRVTGTYADGVLTLTRPPVAAEPAEPDLNFPIPCPTPAGGWHGSDPVNVSRADEAVMDSFASTHHATFGGWWLGHGPAGVIVVGVTNDVAGVQRELSSKLRGDVCVTRVAHTAQYLTAVVNEITRLDMANKQLYLSSWGSSPVSSTVDVRLRIADQAAVRYFADRFPRRDPARALPDSAEVGPRGRGPERRGASSDLLVRSESGSKDFRNKDCV